MGKSIRNTLFTAAVLTLTALGIGWNRQAVESKRPPINISPAVLAFGTTNLSSQSTWLKMGFSQARLKLGQYQTLRVDTLPNAELEISTVYPDGTTDNSQTLRAQADQNGRYQLHFQLNDFSLLGNFSTNVRVISNGQTAAASNQFSLETWASGETPNIGDTKYVYPLLP